MRRPIQGTKQGNRRNIAGFEHRNRKNYRLEASLKRKNLRVLKIPENICTGSVSQFVVQAFEKSSITISLSDIEDVYRIQRVPTKGQRPALISFKSLSVRNEIWANKYKLRNSSLILQEDLPAEWVKRRKELWPIMKLAKKQDSPEKP